MLTIFNRRELTITYNMKRQSEIRDLLAQNGVEYSVKAIGRKSASPFAAGARARMGTMGENLQAANEYVIYVNKSDYSRASAIMNGRISR